MFFFCLGIFIFLATGDINGKYVYSGTCTVDFPKVIFRPVALSRAFFCFCFCFFVFFWLVIVTRIFEMSRCQCAVKIVRVATLAQTRQACNLLLKFQRVELLEIFSAIFRVSHDLYEDGYTCDFRRALVTRQFSRKKSLHYSRGFGLVYTRQSKV